VSSICIPGHFKTEMDELDKLPQKPVKEETFDDPPREIKSVTP
jgi:hypothetical protein